MGCFGLQLSSEASDALRYSLVPKAVRAETRHSLTVQFMVGDQVAVWGMHGWRLCGRDKSSLQKPRQLQSWAIFNFKCLEASCLISGRISG